VVGVGKGVGEGKGRVGSTRPSSKNPLKYTLRQTNRRQQTGRHILVNWATEVETTGPQTMKV